MKKRAIFIIILVVLLTLFLTFWITAFIKVCPDYANTTLDVSVPFYLNYEETIYDKIFDRVCPGLVKLKLISFVNEAVAVESFDTDLANLKDGSPNLVGAYDKIDIFQAWELINNALPQLSLVSIGILDTGVDASNGKHPEFEGVNFGNSPAESLQDNAVRLRSDLEAGHGTPIAGIIGANNLSASQVLSPDSPQMNGVASGISNLPYVMELRGTIFSPVKLGGDIETLPQESLINVSFGHSPCPKILFIEFSKRFCIKEADFDDITSFYLETFTKNGDKTFIIAAGNNDINTEDFIPANIQSDNTIVVSSTDLDDNRAGFSNFGASVAISSPGVQVYAPSIRGKGNFPSSGSEINNYKTNFSGTSVSAPLVTGVAAILKAINPDLTPAQIKQILIETADTISTDKPIGPRLNAFKAVCDPLVLNCVPLSALDDSAWSMFGKDQYHTSLVDIAGPGVSATISWEFDTGFGNSISQPVVSADGDIYFGIASNVSGKIIKLDKNGLEQWEYPTNVNIGTPAILSDETVYFGRIGAGGSLTFTALNSDGTNKWDFGGVSKVLNVTVSSKGEPHFTSIDGTQKLVALNPDGSAKTIISMVGLGGFAPVVLENGDIIAARYVSGNQFFTAYASDGTQLWDLSHSSTGPFGAYNKGLLDPSHDTSTGTTYSAAGPKLFDIPSDGSILNSHNVAPFDHTAATMVAINADTLYIGFNSNINLADSRLYALNKADLTTKWFFQADGHINKQLVIDNADNVYFSTKNGKLYSVEGDGDLRWVIDSGLNSVISPALTQHGLIWSYGNKIVLIK